MLASGWWLCWLHQARTFNSHWTIGSCMRNEVWVRVGMRTCTSKPQTMVLSQERVEVPLQVGDEILDQGEEYQSTRLTDGWSSMKKRELSREAKPSGRCPAEGFLQVPQEGGPRTDPGHAGGTLECLKFPWKSWTN